MSDNRLGISIQCIHAIFFLMVLGAACVSFIKVMQMIHDCRVVTISTNKIMISVMAEFPLATSRQGIFCLLSFLRQLFY